MTGRVALGNDVEPGVFQERALAQVRLAPEPPTTVDPAGQAHAVEAIAATVWLVVVARVHVGVTAVGDPVDPAGQA